MAYFPRSVDYKTAQEKRIKKLKQRLETAEKQMAEQALLRQKLEELCRAQAEGTMIKRNINDWTSSTKFDRIYMHDRIRPSHTSSKAVEEIIARRTKEFQRLQAEKAAKIRNLTKERQKILEARAELMEKHGMFRTLPSPVEQATHRTLGNKYSIYTPLHYDHYMNIYTPAFQDGYYTYFPRAKRKKHWFNSNLLFVPTPLFQSPW